MYRNPSFTRDVFRHRVVSATTQSCQVWVKLNLLLLNRIGVTMNPRMMQPTTSQKGVSKMQRTAQSRCGMTKLDDMHISAVMCLIWGVTEYKASSGAGQNFDKRLQVSTIAGDRTVLCRIQMMR